MNGTALNCSLLIQACKEQANAVDSEVMAKLVGSRNLKRSAFCELAVVEVR